MSNHAVGAMKRLEQLTGPDADLLGVSKASETDEGYYYLALRTWPHPDVDDAWTLSLRYAYLTKGDGSDGWTDQGMNMRVEGDRETFLQALSRMFAGGIPRLGSSRVNPSMSDATED